MAEERENKNLTKNEYLQAESAACLVTLHSRPVQWKRVLCRALRKRRRSKGLLRHASSLHPRRRKKTCTDRFSKPAPFVAQLDSGLQCRPSQDRDKPKESKAKDQRAKGCDGISVARQPCRSFQDGKDTKPGKGKSKGAAASEKGAAGMVNGDTPSLVRCGAVLCEPPNLTEAMTQGQIEEARIQEQSETRARIRRGLDFSSALLSWKPVACEKCGMPITKF